MVKDGRLTSVHISGRLDSFLVLGEFLPIQFHQGLLTLSDEASPEPLTPPPAAHSPIHTAG